MNQGLEVGGMAASRETMKPRPGTVVDTQPMEKAPGPGLASRAPVCPSSGFWFLKPLCSCSQAARVTFWLQDSDFLPTGHVSPLPAALMVSVDV